MCILLFIFNTMLIYAGGYLITVGAFVLWSILESIGNNPYPKLVNSKRHFELAVFIAIPWPITLPIMIWLWMHPLYIKLFKPNENDQK